MIQSTTLPVSVVIPTRNRALVLMKTLQTFFSQTYEAAEYIIIDSSEDDLTEDALKDLTHGHAERIVYQKAQVPGAAQQRNQGVKASGFPFILFADDDVYLEDDCLDKLWQGMQIHPEAGGMSAMITNQKYLPMGSFSTFFATLLYGKRLKTFSGKCIIPGWGMLPEDSDELPEYQSMEWLNLGATLYRKEALPDPPFQGHFKGYSMMEDMTLSVFVSQKWKLYNARTARIFHDSQPGDHKKSMFNLSRMEVVNRYFLMTEIMKKRGFSNYLRFGVYQFYTLIAGSTSVSGVRSLPSVIAGKVVGLIDIISR